MRKHPKRPKDINERAHLIGDILTGNAEETPVQSPKNAYASEFARMGGLVGGKARAKALTKAQRVAIAKKAAKARWGKRK